MGVFNEDIVGSLVLKQANGQARSPRPKHVAFMAVSDPGDTAVQRCRSVSPV